MNRIIILFLLSVTNLLAQDISTTEVKVLEGFKPTIPEANRLNSKATFLDTITKDKIQEYTVISTNLKSDYKIRPLKAAKVKPDKILRLYQSKISLGTGYRAGSKISAIHNSVRSKDVSYGVIFNHFNNNIKIDKKLAGTSNNNFHLYAKKIKKGKIYIVNLDYERIGVFTYGIGTDKKDIEEFANNPYYNRFAYTKFSIYAINSEKESDKMIRNTTFFISDLNERSENQIHLSSNLSKTINGLPFSLEIGFDNYLRYNNSDSQLENTDLKILGFSPITSFTRFGIHFDLGFDFDAGDDFAIGFFPKIKATKELVKDVLLIYGGLDHSEQKHTLKSLSDENPYIHSFGTNQSILRDSSFLQELEITDVQELYVGMRNVLTEGEVFEGSIAYGIVKNFAHFVAHSNENYNRFQVDYLDVKQLHINVNYDKEFNNIISLNVITNYYKWDKKVYHKPNLTCTVSAPVNLRNKINVSPSITYTGVRISKNGVFPSKLHANLGLYYYYSKQLSAHLQFNNLTNSKQDMWIGYREVGFNGVFSINYSF
ncbi:hypothetical protein OAK24_01610 [Flavobacteriales bacterium]|nr:hypothetical protein [Flavobacteriales bacterium]